MSPLPVGVEGVLDALCCVVIAVLQRVYCVVCCVVLRGTAFCVLSERRARRERRSCVCFKQEKDQARAKKRTNRFFPSLAFYAVRSWKDGRKKIGSGERRACACDGVCTGQVCLSECCVDWGVVQ